MTVRCVLRISVLLLLCASVGMGGFGCAPATYQTIGFASGEPVVLDTVFSDDIEPPPATPFSLPPHATGWEITESAVVDVTGDGRAELIVVVWRPWRDWPIMRWHEEESPIASYKDKNGMSCHLIVLEPDTGDEIWAGSALPFPIEDMASGDLDGDGIYEVATIRGEYGKKWCGVWCKRPRFVDIWEWEDMGFVMKWGPIPGRFTGLSITDRDGDGIDDLVLW
ncbi:MAG: hypothetical protein JW885_06195 [Deltaproteobacteria bacterium]|nr:hypothetical protein [Candidatus Zymogenaceae bacterium]